MKRDDEEYCLRSKIRNLDKEFQKLDIQIILVENQVQVKRGPRKIGTGEEGKDNEIE